MKLKTLFKCVSGLAISSSLIPVGMSFNNKPLSLSNQNVGNLDSSNEFTWDIDSSGYISPHDKSQVKGDIVIPAKVGEKTVIGIENNAFRNCSLLNSINIPNSVTNIGEYAFYNCSALTDIMLPNSVEIINKGAFHTCTRLNSINIPGSAIYIGNIVFDGCVSLSNIVLNWSNVNDVNLDSSSFSIGSTQNINIEIRQDIEYSDKNQSEIIKSKYREKLIAAGLTEAATYSTWWDNTTNSPSEDYDITNLNADIETIIGSGFKTWLDGSSTRKLSIKCEVTDNNFNGTAKFNDDYSKIITNITGHKEGIENLDITFTPILTLTDSANNFEKVIHLASGTIHLTNVKHNIIGPVLGGVFGGIGAIGLATGTVVFIKKKKQY
ncbi:MAG: leucine-rich repeat domain-containing protein [Mycoplasma sp.]